MSSTTAASFPTASLSSAGMQALSRLERVLFGRSTADQLAHEAGSYVRVTREVACAVAVYETAAVHAKRLAEVAVSGRMSDLDAGSLAAAEDLMAGARATLAQAGQLHLIEVS